jgi:hypothetical protein
MLDSPSPSKMLGGSNTSAQPSIQGKIDRQMNQLHLPEKKLLGELRGGAITNNSFMYNPLVIQVADFNPENSSRKTFTAHNKRTHLIHTAGVMKHLSEIETAKAQYQPLPFNDETFAGLRRKSENDGNAKKTIEYKSRERRDFPTPNGH